MPWYHAPFYLSHIARCGSSNVLREKVLLTQVNVQTMLWLLILVLLYFPTFQGLCISFDLSLASVAWKKGLSVWHSQRNHDLIAMWLPAIGLYQASPINSRARLRQELTPLFWNTSYWWIVVFCCVPTEDSTRLMASSKSIIIQLVLVKSSGHQNDNNKVMMEL